MGGYSWWNYSLAMLQRPTAASRLNSVNIRNVIRKKISKHSGNRVDSVKADLESNIGLQQQYFRSLWRIYRA
jgi:hypothetical protein